MFALPLTALLACSTPPVFTNITEVSLLEQTGSGINRVAMEGDQLANAKACLYTAQEIPLEETKTELLQEVLLLVVKDRGGDRMFELTTDENLTAAGNAASGKKYYRSDCIYEVIKSPATPLNGAERDRQRNEE
jgi:hypothetical protein